MKKSIYEIDRKRSDVKILKVFLYKAYGGDMLSVHIYDKITNKVYAGSIGVSSYKKEEIKWIKGKGEKTK